MYNFLDLKIEKMYIKHTDIEQGWHVFPLHPVNSYLIFFTVIICKSEICRDIDPHVSDRAIPCQMVSRLTKLQKLRFNNIYVKV